MYKDMPAKGRWPRLRGRRGFTVISVESLKELLRLLPVLNLCCAIFVCLKITVIVRAV